MSAGRYTILLVDDSATMREVLKASLRREDMTVVACPDATRALEEMEQLRPDVVVSDILMPGCDGFELCRRVRRHPRLGTTPVILISSVVSRDVAEKAAAAGASELLRKPFQPGDLVARLRYLLASSPGAARDLEAAGPQEPTPTTAPIAPVAIPSSAVAVLTAAMGAVTAAPAPPSAPATTAIPVSNTAPTEKPAPSAAPASAPATGCDRGQLELQRLQALVRKLQTEVAAEREYVQTLEAQLKSLHRT